MDAPCELLVPGAYIEQEHVEEIDAFTNKVGGQPVVFRNSKQPLDAQLYTCETCGVAKSLLLQVFAPVKNAYQRCIFVFICRTCTAELGRLGSHRLLALTLCTPCSDEAAELSPARKQPINSLAQAFSAFDFSACGDDDINDDEIEQLLNAQLTAGFSSQIVAPPVKSVPAAAASISATDNVPVASEGDNILSSFTSFYLCTVPEPQRRSRSESIELQKVQQMLQQLDRDDGSASESGEGTAGFLPEEFEDDDDKVFRRFSDRVARSPEQCVRYQLNGRPLLQQSNEQNDVPPCPKCGENRTFEMQLMPNLVNCLDDASIVFGTVSLYTCTSSECMALSQDDVVHVEHVIVEESI